MQISELLGETIQCVQVSSDEIRFFTADNLYIMRHDPDCCQPFRVWGFDGNLANFLGRRIKDVLEITGARAPDGYVPEQGDEPTWTVFVFTTNWGAVTVRWLGQHRPSPVLFYQVY